MRVITNTMLGAAALRRELRPRKRHAVHLEGVLGTSLELLVVAKGDEAAHRAERIALDEIDRLDNILSGYSPASEFTRWQRTPECDAVVSPELADVLGMAEHWRVCTAGAFNPGAPAVANALMTTGDVAGVVTRIRQPLWTM